VAELVFDVICKSIPVTASSLKGLVFLTIFELPTVNLLDAGQASDTSKVNLIFA
jgi:hypothetical protein